MNQELIALLDKEAIRDVRARFALALDTKDWDLFKSLFTDSVDVDLPGMGLPQQTLPPEAIAERFRASFAKSQGTQQLYGNFLIDLDGDTATCSSYLLGHHDTPGFEGGEEATLRGRYLDRLARTAGGWKITAMSFQTFSLVGNIGLFT